MRDAIVAADRFAAGDVYRAVTHNKGIMNGIDPLAVATGNDWRAIAAAAHAWAARDGQYRGLTDWRVGDDGELTGELELPLKPGLTGASISQNPGARLALRILGVDNARELAEVMAAVGLMQNFAAIRALALEGIQAGHMRLHARGVVAAAGVPRAESAAVLERLLASGEIKTWKAAEIHRELSGAVKAPGEGATAAGKLILAGEHAVVHGAHALAVPIPDAMRAWVRDTAGEAISIRIPRWDVEREVGSVGDSLDTIATSVSDALAPGIRGVEFVLDARYPAGVGLGASATLAVAIARALDAHLGLGIDAETVNAIAHASEQLTHGNPSGIDDTVATYARPILFRRGDPPEFRELAIALDADIVVGIAEPAPPTGTMVARVGALKQDEPDAVRRIVEGIDAAATTLAASLAAGDAARAGRALDLNQGLLNALGVSTPGLERLISVARRAGAFGAKLTGGGGGGAMLALVDAERAAAVEAALAECGAQTYRVPLRPNSKTQ